MNHLGRYLRAWPIIGLLAIMPTTADAANIIVSSVKVTSDHKKFCPTTLTFGFEVKVSKPGTYFYRHFRSDGTIDAKVHTVTYTKTGTFPLPYPPNPVAPLPNPPGPTAPYSWTLNKSTEGFVAVHFDSSAAGDGNHAFPPDGKIGKFKADCIQFADIFLKVFEVSTDPMDIKKYNGNVCVITSKVLMTVVNKGTGDYQPPPMKPLSYQVGCKDPKNSGCYNNGTSFSVKVPALAAGASVAIDPQALPEFLIFSCPTTTNAMKDGVFTAKPTGCPPGYTVCEGPADTEPISKVIAKAQTINLCPAVCQ